MAALLVTAYRLEDVTYACGVSRFGSDKERTVSTEACSIPLHFPVSHVEHEIFVKQAYHEGSVTGATSESCLHGNPLEKMDVYARDVIMLRNEAVRLHHEVVVSISLHLCARDTYIVSFIQGKIMMHTFHLNGIIKGNGIKDCFKVMITVRSLGYDVESKVYFGTRECNHVSISKDVKIFAMSFFYIAKVIQKVYPAKNRGRKIRDIRKKCANFADAKTT